MGHRARITHVSPPFCQKQKQKTKNKKTKKKKKEKKKKSKQKKHKKTKQNKTKKKIIKKNQLKKKSVELRDDLIFSLGYVGSLILVTKFSHMKRRRIASLA